MGIGSSALVYLPEQENNFLNVSEVLVDSVVTANNENSEIVLITLVI